MLLEVLWLTISSLVQAESSKMKEGQTAASKGPDGMAEMGPLASICIIA